MPIIKQQRVSQETRQQIIQRFLQHPNEDAIAYEFRRSYSTVSRIVREYFNTKPNITEIISNGKYQHQPNPTHCRSDKEN